MDGSGKVFDRRRAREVPPASGLRFARVRDRGTVGLASWGSRSGSTLSSKLAHETFDADTTCGSFFGEEYAHCGESVFVCEKGVLVEAALHSSPGEIIPMVEGDKLELFPTFVTMIGGGFIAEKRDLVCAGFSAAPER
jgi:hypothetical protein